MIQPSLCTLRESFVEVMEPCQILALTAFLI